MNSNNVDNEQTKNDWNSWSHEYYEKIYKDSNVISIIKNNPSLVFPTKVWECIQLYFPKLNGIKICVPSSGDNLVAFAFHLLGAEVTSCDISSEQIKNAKTISVKQGWDINYMECDSMLMNGIEDEYFDLVYTSNGVHTWITNLELMYKNFNRILKDEGKYIFFETHPFIRPFDDSTNILAVKKRYDSIDGNDWRVQDFVNALISSGFIIKQLNEMFAEKHCIGAEWWHRDQFDWDLMADWRENPYAALPQWVFFCAIK